MTLDTTTRIPDCTCPACGHALSGASGEGAPSPGDLSVCIACGAYLTFTAELTVRAVTEDELDALDAESRVELERHRYAAQLADQLAKRLH